MATFTPSETLIEDVMITAGVHVGAGIPSFDDVMYTVAPGERAVIRTLDIRLMFQNTFGVLEFLIRKNEQPLLNAPASNLVLASLDNNTDIFGKATLFEMTYYSETPVFQNEIYRDDLFYSEINMYQGDVLALTYLKGVATAPVINTTVTFNVKNYSLFG